MCPEEFADDHSKTLKIYFREGDNKKHMLIKL